MSLKNKFSQFTALSTNDDESDTMMTSTETMITTDSDNGNYLQVTSPTTNASHESARYDVNNPLTLQDIDKIDSEIHGFADSEEDIDESKLKLTRVGK